MAVSIPAQHQSFLNEVQKRNDFWLTIFFLGLVGELPVIATFFMNVPGFLVIPFGIVAPMMIILSGAKLFKYHALKMRAMNYLNTPQTPVTHYHYPTATAKPVVTHEEPELILYEKFPNPVVPQRKALNTFL